MSFRRLTVSCSMIAYMLVATSCDSDSDSSDDSDGGISNNDAGDPGPGPSPEPEPTGPGNDDDCEGQVVRVCVDGNVVDRCSSTMEEVEVEECDAECFQGACVDCLPTGYECDDDDRYQRDSCDGRELIESCDFGCASGDCIGEECEPRASRECVGEFLFSLNSCGDQENIEQVCEGGCEDDACVGCEDDGELTCYDGDIYGVDSCGQITARVTDCMETCRTSGVASGDAECVSSTECAGTEGIACALGDIHTVDSCGNVLVEIVEECPNGCDEDGCRACEERPVGTGCVGDSVYRLIGGCGEAAVPEATALEVCEFGCEAGACLDSECTPNVGRTCSDGDVYSVDSCDEIGTVVESCDFGCVGAECVDGSGGAGGAGGAGGSGGDGGVAAGGEGGSIDGGTAGLGGSGGSPADGGVNNGGADAGTADAGGSAGSGGTGGSGGQASGGGGAGGSAGSGIDGGLGG